MSQAYAEPNAEFGLSYRLIAADGTGPLRAAWLKSDLQLNYLRKAWRSKLRVSAPLGACVGHGRDPGWMTVIAQVCDERSL
jgi:hypothetical protein